MPGTLKLVAAHNAEQRLQAFIVRGIVFCDEQKVPYAIEQDGLDDTCLHLLGCIGTEPVAAGRIRFLNDYAKLERIAIRRPYRKQGYGSQLLRFMLENAQNLGYQECQLHAQTHSSGFYEQHGFASFGNPFMDAGIEHIAMKLALSAD